MAPASEDNLHSIDLGRSSRVQIAREGEEKRGLTLPYSANVEVWKMRIIAPVTTDPNLTCVRDSIHGDGT